MGLPIKHRKKYIFHKKRWDKNIILDEAVLIKDYALKNKKEIRKIEFLISKYKKIAKFLNRNTQLKESEQAQLFIQKLKDKGFVNIDAVSLDEILDIKIRDILERRLSNIVYKLKLARSPKQARQFIVHKHITINGQLISSPSYLVSLNEELTVGFLNSSNLNDEEHPERKILVHGVEEELTEMKKIDKSEDQVPQIDKSDDEELDEVKN